MTVALSEIRSIVGTNLKISFNLIRKKSFTRPEHLKIFWGPRSSRSGSKNNQILIKSKQVITKCLWEESGCLFAPNKNIRWLVCRGPTLDASFPFNWSFPILSSHPCREPPLHNLLVVERGRLPMSANSLLLLRACNTWNAPESATVSWWCDGAKWP